jgi:hypothetical protein
MSPLQKLLAAAALALILPAPLSAQAGGTGTDSWLFPGVKYFRELFADPYDPRLSIALVRTDLFESRGPERPPYERSPGTEPEVQAAAAIGVAFPIFHVHRGEGSGVTIGVQAGVFARFRIEHPSRDDLGQDWFVGMPIDAAWGTSALRFRLIHRSSHLGDEFSETTGGRRIEFGGEAFDLLLAREVGPIRAYGGAGWIFHSNTGATRVLRELDRPDRFTAQAGLDGVWRPFADPRLSIRAGADWQSAERTKWRSTWALAGGFAADTGRGGASIVLRYTGGQSALGQFFLTAEEAFTLEVGIRGGS